MSYLTLSKNFSSLGEKQMHWIASLVQIPFALTLLLQHLENCSFSRSGQFWHKQTGTLSSIAGISVGVDLTVSEDAIGSSLKILKIVFQEICLTLSTSMGLEESAGQTTWSWTWLSLFKKIWNMVRKKISLHLSTYPWQEWQEWEAGVQHSQAS